MLRLLLLALLGAMFAAAAYSECTVQKAASVDGEFSYLCTTANQFRLPLHLRDATKDALDLQADDQITVKIEAGGTVFESVNTKFWLPSRKAPSFNVMSGPATDAFQAAIASGAPISAWAIGPYGTRFDLFSTVFVTPQAVKTAPSSKPVPDPAPAPLTQAPLDGFEAEIAQAFDNSHTTKFLLDRSCVIASGRAKQSAIRADLIATQRASFSASSSASSAMQQVLEHNIRQLENNQHHELFADRVLDRMMRDGECRSSSKARAYIYNACSKAARSNCSCVDDHFADNFVSGTHLGARSEIVNLRDDAFAACH